MINKDTVGTNSGCSSVLSSLHSGLYPGGAAACYKPHAAYTRDELLGTGVHRSCNKNASNINQLGDACAAVIMLDGWEIKKDYPW